MKGKEKEIAIGIAFIALIILAVIVVKPNNAIDIVTDSNGKLELRFDLSKPVFATISTSGGNTIEQCQAASQYYSQFCTITTSCQLSGNSYVIQGDNCPNGGWGAGTSSSPSHFGEGTYLVCKDIGGSFSASGTTGGTCSMPIPDGCTIGGTQGCNPSTKEIRQFSSNCMASGFVTDLTMCEQAPINQTCPNGATNFPTCTLPPGPNPNPTPTGYEPLIFILMIGMLGIVVYIVYRRLK